MGSDLNWFWFKLVLVGRQICMSPSGVCLD